MRFQSYFTLPFIGISLPSLVYAGPAFTIQFIDVFLGSPQEGRYPTYTLNLFRPGQENTPAICEGRFQEKGLIGEQRMRCLQLPGETVDLERELNVRIQQPDNLKPDVSGFNVLVDWSGVTSRVNFGGTPLEQTPGWRFSKEINTWKTTQWIYLDEKP